MADRPNPRQGANTATLLLQAHLRLADRINAAVIARGYPIRPAHSAVFVHMDLSGIRLTQLAEKAQMTPQSMAELVDDLVGLGYLERVPDQTDRRAKLIVFTDSGLDTLHAGLEVVAEVEQGLERLLGKTRAHDLRTTLDDIITPGGSVNDGLG